jgi:hypothetical protein
MRAEARAASAALRYEELALSARFAAVESARLSFVLLYPVRD